jgi:hypothetical protein
MTLTDKFKVFWTKDRAIFMACMGIALCFWILNKMSTSYRKIKTIAIEYAVPNGKALKTPPPQYVTATMQGTGWDLIAGNNIKGYITLTEDSIQAFSYKDILAQQIGGDVVAATPDFITFELEDAVSKTVPIEVVTQLSFEPGYALSEKVELTPSVVTVNGPRTILEGLQSIKTDTLKILRMKGEKTQNIRLMRYPLFTYKITETQAHVRVEQYTEKSFFIPINIKNAPQSLKIFPNKIKLDCAVPLSKYAQMTASQFVVEADMKDVTFDLKDNTVPIVLVSQPNYIQNLKFSPKLAEYYFEKNN